MSATMEFKHWLKNWNVNTLKCNKYCFQSQRYYKNKYLEICEVFDEVVEVSLFSSVDKPYEIYFSLNINECVYQRYRTKINKILTPYTTPRII